MYLICFKWHRTLPKETKTQINNKPKYFYARFEEEWTVMGGL